MKKCVHLGGIVTKRTYSSFKPPELKKQNWEQDVVYLYQFKRSPVIPNLSPFCLKVETFLRSKKIKYEPIGSWFARSQKGKLPFIELNGSQIADSQLILWHLQKHFKIDDGLSQEQLGIARAVDRLVEGSSFPAITYFRSVESGQNMFNSHITGLSLPGFVSSFVAKKFADITLQRLKLEGTALHNRETIIEILRRDVKAIDQILGDKKFIIGIQPTIPDFTVFGHFGCAYFLPFRQPIQDILNDEFPRVRQLLERMRLHYWNDWPGK